MKKFLALVLALVMTMSLVTIGANAKTADYSDAKDVTNVEAVDVLSEMGILVGYNGAFSPKATITRGAAAKIVAYLALGQSAADALTASGTIFKDVPANSAVAPYIEWCAKNGIVNGYGDKVFGLKDKVTKNAFVKMLLGVIGYGQNSEFVGGGWQANVISKATQLGIMTGTEKAGYATRDDAAQFAFNSLLVHFVAYVPYLNQYSDGVWVGGDMQLINGLTNNSILTNGEINIANRFLLTKDNTVDAFGRSTHTWYIGRPTRTIGVYDNAAVLSYTTAVSECDILHDLGITSDRTVTSYLVDGKQQLTGGVDAMDALNVLSTAKTIGGQGALTLVYRTYAEGVLTDAGHLASYTDQYQVVTINTYLAKVVNVLAEAYDANGHVSRAGTVTLSVYDKLGAAESAVTRVYAAGSAAANYKVGDYALVTMAGPETSTGGTNVTEPVAYTDYTVKSATVVTPAATGVLTGWTTSAVTVGGVTYTDACKFDLGYGSSTNAIYNVYVDAYGNVIGLVQPATVYSYGVFDAIAWQNAQGLVTEHILANVIAMNGDKAEKVTVSKTEKDTTLINAADSTLTNADAVTNYAGDIETGTVSTDMLKNGEYYPHLYRFSTNAAGEYVIETVGACANAGNVVNIVKGTSNRWGTLVTNDYTQYLVKTLDANKNAVYTAYTGYQNIPSMTGVKVCYMSPDDTTYVTYAFVDATKAIVGGTSYVAFIGDAVKDADNGLNGYTVYVNGEAKTVYAENRDTLTALTDDFTKNFTVPGLYVINCDAAGNACTNAAAGVNALVYLGTTVASNYVKNITGVTNCTDTVITNGLQDIDLLNATFYKVAADGKSVAASTLAELVSYLGENQSLYPTKKAYTVNATVQFTSADTAHGVAVYYTLTANKANTQAATMKLSAANVTSLGTVSASPYTYTTADANLNSYATGTAILAYAFSNTNLTANATQLAADNIVTFYTTDTANYVVK